MSQWQGESGGVIAELDRGVAMITLNRPDKLNALNEATLADLSSAIRSCDKDPESLGIVITGAGSAFSAGHDLDSAASLGVADIGRVIDCFNDVTRAILSTNVPVAAAINGIAVGGGAEFTLSCDTRIAGRRGEVFLPENGRGLSISNGTSYLLPRLIGSHALPLVIDSRRLSAEEALRIGLIDEIVADDQLLDVTAAKVRRWGAHGTATAQHLRVMRPSLKDVEIAMRHELEGAREALQSGITTRGVRAFLDRDRAPTMREG